MNREGLTIKMDREALLKVADRPIELPLLAKDQMWKHVSELQETRRKPIPWMYLRLSASRAISVPTARNAALQAELFRIFTNGLYAYEFLGVASPRHGINVERTIGYLWR